MHVFEKGFYFIFNLFQSSGEMFATLAASSYQRLQLSAVTWPPRASATDLLSHRHGKQHSPNGKNGVASAERERERARERGGGKSECLISVNFNCDY